MIVLYVAGGWILLGTIVGLWLGAVLRQRAHEDRLADIYERRQVREQAMHRNGHRTSREAVRNTIKRGEVNR